MLQSDGFDSPVRPLRMPRFSTNGWDSPDENRPAHSANQATSSSPAFPRQYVASPAKFKDRNVLFLLGSKINSSVPGRRSSIACSKDRKAMAPVLELEEELTSEYNRPETDTTTKEHSKRSRSMKATIAGTYVGPSTGARSLRRL